ncbi:unnamed protein product [Amoebophrya sp. A25]|nr:unnamed protein product [Amoebophrya sp. A25]|eukprot:GSA25T00018841001.1
MPSFAVTSSSPIKDYKTGSERPPGIEDHASRKQSWEGGTKKADPAAPSYSSCSSAATPSGGLVWSSNAAEWMPCRVVQNSDAGMLVRYAVTANGGAESWFEKFLTPSMQRRLFRAAAKAQPQPAQPSAPNRPDQATAAAQGHQIAGADAVDEDGTTPVEPAANTRKRSNSDSSTGTVQLYARLSVVSSPNRGKPATRATASGSATASDCKESHAVQPPESAPSPKYPAAPREGQRRATLVVASRDQQAASGEVGRAVLAGAFAWSDSSTDLLQPAKDCTNGFQVVAVLHRLRTSLKNYEQKINTLKQRLLHRERGTTPATTQSSTVSPRLADTGSTVVSSLKLPGSSSGTGLLSDKALKAGVLSAVVSLPSTSKSNSVSPAASSCVLTEVGAATSSSSSRSLFTAASRLQKTAQKIRKTQHMIPLLEKIQDGGQPQGPLGAMNKGFSQGAGGADSSRTSSSSPASTSAASISREANMLVYQLDRLRDRLQQCRREVVCPRFAGCQTVLREVDSLATTLDYSVSRCKGCLVALAVEHLRLLPAVHLFSAVLEENTTDTICRKPPEPDGGDAAQAEDCEARRARSSVGRVSDGAKTMTKEIRPPAPLTLGGRRLSIFLCPNPSSNFPMFVPGIDAEVRGKRGNFVLQRSSAAAKNSILGGLDVRCSAASTDAAMPPTVFASIKKDQIMDAVGSPIYEVFSGIDEEQKFPYHCKFQTADGARNSVLIIGFDFEVALAANPEQDSNVNQRSRSTAGGAFTGNKFGEVYNMFGEVVADLLMDRTQNQLHCQFTSDCNHIDAGLVLMATILIGSSVPRTKRR